MHITAISLSGFKSFAEATELPVDSGLTVVIGPNGCGKSNIIEAVRWVMGEGSAKRLRGAEMEDVIFAGTRQRRRRQSAEVKVTLDNASRTAPPPFQDASELVVSRRIERGHGSTYRINNKEVRAKDVQMLFADLSIGSRSASIISQGEVAELVENKPDARRLLLEEAAGIRGLQARRHESELKLKQAATNLLRIQDILDHGQGELQNLETQARATKRYRELMGRKRYYQALFWWVQNRDAAAELDQLRTEFSAKKLSHQQAVDAHNAGVVVVTRSEADLVRVRAEDEAQIEELNSLRDAWQDLQRSSERLEGERSRDLERIEDSQLALSGLDVRLADHQHRRAELEAEMQDDDTEGEDIADTSESLSSLKLKLQNLEALCTEDKKAEAEQNLEHQRVADQLQTLTEQQQKLQGDYSELHSSDQRLQQALSAMPAEEKAENDAIQLLLQAKSAAEQLVQQAYDTWSSCRERPADLIEAQAGLAAKTTDLSELKRRLDSSKRAWQAWQAQQGQGLIAEWAAPPELALALEAALGVGLTAGTVQTAGYYWQQRDYVASPPALPEAVPSLWTCLEQSEKLLPAAWQFLKIPLLWVGVVDDEQSLQRLLPQLQAGQSLVTRDGAAMGWNGLGHGVDNSRLDVSQWSQGHVWQEIEQKFDADQATLHRLQQLVQQADQHWAEQKDKAEAVYRNAEAGRKEAEQLWLAAEQARNQAEIALKAERAKRQRLEVEVAANQVQSDRISNQLSEIKIQLNNVQLRFQLVQSYSPDPAIAERQDELQALQVQVAEATSAEIRLVAQFEARLQAKKQRMAETERLAKDEADTLKQQAELQQRLADLRENQHSSKDIYADLSDQAAQAEQLWKDQDRLRQSTAGHVQKAIAVHDQAQQSVHRLAMAAAQTREEFVRAEASLEHKTEARQTLFDQAQQSMGQRIETLQQTFDFIEKDRNASLAEVNGSLAMETRRLDSLGEVNLRADIDLEDKRQELELMMSESADIQSAIDDLKGAISDLNIQGRARLFETFKSMKLLFSEHFQKLFSGGEANLVWIETDDPIAPGIDIRARPPGKAMQSVYLLSGGEKALTALALIGAVLRLRPTPICLLDEVDAALDDANVARFCGLLAELGQSNPNMRFVIISHHRLSMAKADHLMGVGMPERGVSRLYAVDMLEATEAMHQSD